MNGVLPLWKERGMTSHDCVFKLRKILKTKKVGHTGTLDPDVDGVLPICIGTATKVAEYITDQGKTYEAEVTLGYSTETEDASGATVDVDDTEKYLGRSDLLKALEDLTGEIMQTPPMYSAVKVNGKKLYEYARQGIQVERPQRVVRIDSIELLDGQSEWIGKELKFSIRIKCGKGTYIRTLAVQIGEALGYPAHMSKLTRTESGKFATKDCVTLAEVAELAQNEDIGSILKPLSYGLSNFPFVEVDKKDIFAIKNGQVLDRHPLMETQEFLVFAVNGQPLALYKRHPERVDKMKPEKMFGIPSINEV
ncbi:tRNA pseudouridine(55) synthase TruB [Planococcus shenhongbingii]|uniref:tRNA pseudouridine synthase B n=1 Tax=Planococcus shenhongbingii TaxID=3058398 RepID=A0ABT8N8H9_9BACL|nr:MULTISPECIES: tRNA pseudouridine(55) synthase TruB [unclassified Planococcus (in: firmicutes)]MDN7244176.1 tRNA pseudouridine(55) synthase TruB [Planococcus sp. N017]WKA60485.1 tRNA pseudouridine(55) synthase TruB [Planococcus sp. N016]